MWFLLLVLVETGVYTAEVVHKDLETCVANRTTEQDLCVPVSVQLETS